MEQRQRASKRALNVVLPEGWPLVTVLSSQATRSKWTGSWIELVCARASWHGAELVSSDDSYYWLDLALGLFKSALARYRRLHTKLSSTQLNSLVVVAFTPSPSLTLWLQLAHDSFLLCVLSWFQCRNNDIARQQAAPKASVVCAQSRGDDINFPLGRSLDTVTSKARTHTQCSIA